MPSQTVVIACPHCGKQQSQSVESSQGTRKTCSNMKGGCGRTYYVQTSSNGLIERVDQ